MVQGPLETLYGVNGIDDLMNKGLRLGEFELFPKSLFDLTE